MRHGVEDDPPAIGAQDERPDQDDDGEADQPRVRVGDRVPDGAPVDIVQGDVERDGADGEAGEDV
jgi:hypothetical protein